MTLRTYYEVLGVNKSCTAADVRRAYRRQALRHHPDKSSAPDAEQTFKLVGEAHGVLSDPMKRTLYDSHLRSGSDGAFDAEHGGIPVPEWYEGSGWIVAAKNAAYGLVYYGCIGVLLMAVCAGAAAQDFAEYCQSVHGQCQRMSPRSSAASGTENAASRLKLLLAVAGWLAPGAAVSRWSVVALALALALVPSDAVRLAGRDSASAVWRAAPGACTLSAPAL